MQLFDYLIHSTDTDHPYDPPIEFHIQYTIEKYSPQLNINEKTELLVIRTPEGFKASMQNPVRLDNRDFHSQSSGILDIAGNPLMAEDNKPLIFTLAESPLIDM